MTINERFEWIIKILFHDNKSAFAKSVGISPTVVENVVGTRKGKPSYDVLYKVCANANISAEWLFFGEESDPVMRMFNIRKELELTAPYIDDNGDEKEMKTIFEKGRRDTEEQTPNTNNTDLIQHLKAQSKEKDIEIGALREDIGVLKERIRQLEQRLGKDAERVSTVVTANVG
ncbi:MULTISPECIES: hypothetical protein [Bacteroidales]|jgi:transcriptional regulator with XRE-family HTH domain|uniref:hypothetical protein n=1 Tax=Bacteroidales TaxID=171549 RepID=UPI0015881FC0|nr:MULTISPECIES: hypothetical protein [Bacteroidales]